MRSKKHERKLFAIAAVATIISAAMYDSWPLGFWLNPLASRKGLASELGAFGQPYNWVFIWGDITSGILLVAAVVILLRVYRPKKWARLALVLLAIYGVAGALDAALPMSCLPSEQACGSVFNDPLLILHGIFDISGSTALIGTLIATAVHVHKYSVDKEWKTWIYAIGIGGTTFALISGIFYVWGGPGYWAQRYYITLSCVWVASIPFVLRPKRAILVKP